MARIHALLDDARPGVFNEARTAAIEPDDNGLSHALHPIRALVELTSLRAIAGLASARHASGNLVPWEEPAIAADEEPIGYSA